jgi:hypothetical protein
MGDADQRSKQIRGVKIFSQIAALFRAPHQFIDRPLPKPIPVAPPITTTRFPSSDIAVLVMLFPLLDCRHGPVGFQFSSCCVTREQFGQDNRGIPGRHSPAS